METGWTLFQAARDGGLVGADEIDAFAAVVHEAVTQDLLRYRMRNAGLVELPASVP